MRGNSAACYVEKPRLGASATLCTRSRSGRDRKNPDRAIGCSGAPEGYRSAIGKPEICDRDRMVIGHQMTALPVGILAIEVCVCVCDQLQSLIAMSVIVIVGVGFVLNGHFWDQEKAFKHAKIFPRKKRQAVKWIPFHVHGGLWAIPSHIRITTSILLV